MFINNIFFYFFYVVLAFLSVADVALLHVDGGRTRKSKSRTLI